jgi:hypothetical protein
LSAQDFKLSVQQHQQQQQQQQQPRQQQLQLIFYAFPGSELCARQVLTSYSLAICSWMGCSKFSSKKMIKPNIPFFGTVFDAV